MRHWWRCRCGQSEGSYAADDILGLEGSLSRPLQRHICRLGADVSFAKTREHVLEMFGQQLGEEIIRQCCENHGKCMVRWQHKDTSIPKQFQKATGEMEFTADAGKVNTKEAGWRDLKIAVFQKRPLAKPCGVSEWATRELPSATATVAWADITKSDRFRTTWRRMAARLGVRETKKLHALADGASWIWRSMAAVLGGSRETLDVYHGLEHIAKAGEKLYGKGTDALNEFLSRGRVHLLESGWQGVTKLVGEELEKEDTAPRRQALEKLINYFAPHFSRLDYAGCLREGRAIGSGVVEGWAKTLGLRLKARGARWKNRNAVAMAALGCVRNTDQWEAYWALAS